MHSAELTPSVLAELRRPRRYPAVSLVMPTHRSEPENAQDAVRLRNLVADAKARLHADESVSRADRLDVLDQLDRAVADVDLVHAEDGLVILVAPGEHQVWSIPRTVPTRIVFAETFLTRNLVATQVAAAPYWVLTISAERSALFGGSGKGLTEYTRQGFPREQEPDQPDVERKERIGDVPSTFRDEQTRHFIREADSALGAVLEADPRPVFVVGDAPALAVLGEVGTAAKTAVAHVVRGGLAHAAPAAVREAVTGALGEQAVRAVGQAKERLSQAKGTRSLAAGIDEVWRNVSEGRVALVVLEEHYWEPVLVTDNHLVPARAETPEVREDMVDEIVERALDTGAQVQFVPTDELADYDRIAAVLRY